MEYKIKAEQFLITSKGWELTTCNNDVYFISKCNCNNCHDLRKGE